MDSKRAAKIAESPVMANVSYKGRKIYIERVNEDNGVASISPIEERGNTIDVSVSNLIEH